MNKTTVSLTQEQYTEIIKTMKEGFSGCRPNSRVAMALTIEANLGLRVSDIVQLKLKDIIRDGRVSSSLSVPSIRHEIKCFVLVVGITMRPRSSVSI